MRPDAQTGRRAGALYLLAALTLLTAPTVKAQDVGLDIGATPAAPALVQDMDGRPADLARLFVGTKPVLIEFWATWCPICAALLPKMEAAHRRYGARVEFVVVGVGVNETIETMRRHIERHPMPFRFYFDNAGAAVRSFEAPSTSYIVALDARGHVVYTGTGENQNVDAAARRAAGGR